MSPEQKLWVAVLETAIEDMFCGNAMDAGCMIDEDQARGFIMRGGPWFRQVCDMAGINPGWVLRKVNESMSQPHVIARSRA